VQLVGAAPVARKSSGMAEEGWEVGGRSESRLKEEGGLCFIGSTTNGQNWLAEQVG